MIKNIPISASELNLMVSDKHFIQGKMVKIIKDEHYTAKDPITNSDPVTVGAGLTVPININISQKDGGSNFNFLALAFRAFFTTAGATTGADLLWSLVYNGKTIKENMRFIQMNVISTNAYEHNEYFGFPFNYYTVVTLNLTNQSLASANIYFTMLGLDYLN